MMLKAPPEYINKNKPKQSPNIPTINKALINETREKLSKIASNIIKRDSVINTYI